MDQPTDEEIINQVILTTIGFVSERLGLDLPEDTTLGDLLIGDDDG